MKVKTLVLAVLLASTLATQASATSFVTKETCTAPESDSYRCVVGTGYKGTDPYGLHAYSKTNPVDRTKHGCTSYAAYMLSKNNPWIRGLSSFNAARSWAHDALTKTTGAVVDQDPSGGDIAQWGKPTDADPGHVAYVEQVLLNESGATIGIIVSDDNGGTRHVTTRKTIMKASTTSTLSWPDNFITFPLYGASGGGKDGWLMMSIRPNA